jgi:alkanesulfonate monooxygenase SsuD/methylene tetrahydromethanopterin reductase-like flavin-dependent oxidoreductase (luciferase family)
MDFNHFVSSYYPDPAYGGARLYDDMIEQAKTAERLGYNSVSIPEHHVINILLNPAPLQFAVRLACETEHIDLVTSVAVLPLHDMRVFAGEVAMADILTKGRLVLGVGRGAFGYEMERLGTPLDQSRAKFDESLDVLLRLLTEFEVEHHGEFYDFDPITIMPRPYTSPRPRMMIATMNHAGIRSATLRGFNIQTTPLAGDPDLFRMQVDAHKEAKAEMGAEGDDLRIMLSRIVYCATDAADARQKLELAHDYYSRFDNVFTGPGIVENGCIAPLQRAQTIEELDNNIMICTADEMVERLGEYHERGIDEFIFSSNIGQSQAETLDMMERIAADVMPHFPGAHRPESAVAAEGVR